MVLGLINRFTFLNLQGARDLAKPPTLTEIFQSNLNSSDGKEDDPEKQQKEAELKNGLKRKFDQSHASEDEEDESQKANDEQTLKDGKLNRAKNVGSLVLFSYSAILGGTRRFDKLFFPLL